MKKNLLIAISALTLVCGVCSVGAATIEDTTASGSAVTVEIKHKNNERQKGDMAKVTAITSDTLTILKAEKPEIDNDNTDRPERPEKPENDTDKANRPERPEKPENDTDKANRPERPEKPNTNTDETADGNTENIPKDKARKMPELTFTEETTTIDLSSVKIYKMGKNHQKTECAYSDISEEDIVTIVYDDDGTTPKEIIISPKNL